MAPINSADHHRPLGYGHGSGNMTRDIRRKDEGLAALGSACGERSIGLWNSSYFKCCADRTSPGPHRAYRLTKLLRRDTEIRRPVSQLVVSRHVDTLALQRLYDRRYGCIHKLSVLFTGDSSLLLFTPTMASTLFMTASSQHRRSRPYSVKRFACHRKGCSCPAAASVRQRTLCFEAATGQVPIFNSRSGWRQSRCIGA